MPTHTVLNAAPRVMHSRHCRGWRIRPGPARLDRGDHWPRPGGFGRGFPTADPPGTRRSALDCGVDNGAFARFRAAGGLSLGMSNSVAGDP